MPKRDGFIEYKCDHCGRTEYLTRDDVAASKKFREHRYINMDDVEFDELICDKCENEYRLMRNKCDAEHYDFVKSGKDFDAKDGDK